MVSSTYGISSCLAVGLKLFIRAVMLSDICASMQTVTECGSVLQ